MNEVEQIIVDEIKKEFPFVKEYDLRAVSTKIMGRLDREVKMKIIQPIPPTWVNWLRDDHQKLCMKLYHTPFELTQSELKYLSDLGYRVSNECY